MNRVKTHIFSLPLFDAYQRSLENNKLNDNISNIVMYENDLSNQIDGMIKKNLTNTSRLSRTAGS